MTGTQMLTAIKILMQDTNLSDANVILPILNLLMKVRCTDLALKSRDWYYEIVSVTLSADEYSFTLPDGTLYSAAPRATDHIHYIKDMDANGVSLKEGWISAEDFDWTKSGTPDRFALKARTVYLNRALTSGRTYSLAYYAIPADITAGSVALEFPDSFLLGLVTETVDFLKMRANQDPTWWRSKADVMYDLSASVQSDGGVHHKPKGMKMEIDRRG